MVSDYTVKECVEQIFLWQYCRAGSFVTKFCECWMAADQNNKLLLSKALPNMCTALTLWYESEFREEFFRSFDLTI